MNELAKLLDALRAAGAIRTYAIFGAIAQIRYTVPVTTVDVDVLVEVHEPQRLDILAPIHEVCRKLGYEEEGQAIKVGAWPVRFVPAWDDLTHDAVTFAESGDYDGVTLRVISAAYLAVIALSVGRAKDYARILALLDAESSSKEAIQSLAIRYGLGERWTKFARCMLDG